MGNFDTTTLVHALFKQLTEIRRVQIEIQWMPIAITHFGLLSLLIEPRTNLPLADATSAMIKMLQLEMIATGERCCHIQCRSIIAAFNSLIARRATAASATASYGDNSAD